MSCVTDGSHRDSLLLNSFLPSLPSQELVGSSEALEIEEVECNDVVGCVAEGEVYCFVIGRHMVKVVCFIVG